MKMWISAYDTCLRGEDTTFSANTKKIPQTITCQREVKLISIENSFYLFHLQLYTASYIFIKKHEVTFISSALRSSCQPAWPQSG